MATRRMVCNGSGESKHCPKCDWSQPWEAEETDVGMVPFPIPLARLLRPNTQYPTWHSRPLNCPYAVGMGWARVRMIEVTE